MEASSVLIKDEIRGFHLAYYDNVYVRVDISTKHNELELNDLADTRIAFGCRQEVLLSWNCFASHNRMVFLAKSQHVGSILNGIQYVVTGPSTEQTVDILTVRVYGGIGGDCLTAEEHLHFSHFEVIGIDCFVDETSTVLRARPSFEGSTTSPGDEFQSGDTIRNSDSAHSNQQPSDLSSMVAIGLVVACFVFCAVNIAMMITVSSKEFN